MIVNCIKKVIVFIYWYTRRKYVMANKWNSLKCAYFEGGVLKYVQQTFTRSQTEGELIGFGKRFLCRNVREYHVWTLLFQNYL